jgi:hypothetical protein
MPRRVRRSVIALVPSLAVAALLLPAVASAATWSIQTAPSISGATNSNLLAVSCPTSTSCTATGLYTNEAKAILPLAEHWNGSTWTLQTTPKGNTVSELAGVSCASSTSCTAVGVEFTGGVALPVAEHWNGTEWTKQFVSTSSGHLYAVSCSSATACTAVGGGRTLNTVPARAFRWNGTEWQSQKIPTPSGANEKEVVLNGVSCVSSTFCMATGLYVNSAKEKVTFSAAWNGSEWTIRSTPNPSETKSNQLTGVSCTSSTACTAVGDAVTTTPGKIIPIVERWNGTEWVIQNNPAELQGKLYGAACTSATKCIAAGKEEGKGGGPLAEQWNGTEWTKQTVPFPEGAVFAGFDGVACSAETACTGVGWSLGKGGSTALLVERYE